MATIYKQGSRGAVVKQIQKVLKCYPDGVWGPRTTEALKDWQKKNGLKPDGLAGPATLSRMGISVVADAVTPRDYTDIYHFGIWLKKSKRRIKEIIVHCTASREGQALTVEQIRQDHIKNNHWSDIGYHYVVDLQGHTRLGRDVDISGAHAEGHNSYSIGVVYVGGLENRPNVPYKDLKAKDTRTPAQKAELLSLLMDLRKLYPDARIIGHRDVSSKACPSFDARREYSAI